MRTPTDPNQSIRRLCGEPLLAAVLVVGVVVRAVLIPITYGDDFIVWDKSAAALLHGHNFYAHHPGYPHGPFAYFPLFVYLELPFRWLALHSSISFTVLGKLPILAADVACAVLIAGALRRRGCRPRTIAIGAALYFLNPLVVYNSAWYGRFDSLGCALLLVALRLVAAQGTRARWPALWWGLATAAKTFPGFLLPGVLRQSGPKRWRVLIGAALVVIVVSAPFLGTPVAFLHDLAGRDVAKSPSGLSWQYLLNAPLGDGGAKVVSYVLLVAFVVGAFWLSRIADLWWYASLNLVLFILLSKLVLKQYLIWPMPWLILIGLTVRNRSGRSCLAVLGAFTVIGMFDNEDLHPFGRSSWLISLLLVITCVAHLWIGVRRPLGNGGEREAVGDHAARAVA